MDGPERDLLLRIGRRFSPTQTYGELKLLGRYCLLSPLWVVSPDIFPDGDDAYPHDFPDPNPIELGVKLRSDVSGYITGVRFYKTLSR